ncbi:MAG: bifunctional nuclease family protein [Candidatus Eisenbacteria bacterium]
MMIQVKIHSLALDEKNQFPVVILQTLDASRQLPIWIGPAEWNAIQAEVLGKRFQRLLTHDLLVAIIHGLGATVLRIEIVDLVENTFFARIYSSRPPGASIVIDARPSDLLAVAEGQGEDLRRVEALQQRDRGADPRRVEESVVEPSEEERSRGCARRSEQLNLRDFGRFSSF